MRLLVLLTRRGVNNDKQGPNNRCHALDEVAEDKSQESVDCIDVLSKSVDYPTQGSGVEEEHRCVENTLEQG